MTTRRHTGRVRKQYHLRRSDDGVDAWDVDRLIELSASLPTERVPLHEIVELDAPYWFHDVEEATVRAVVEHARLIREVDPSYPVILDPDGRVMDGMHRVARAMLDGRASIEAVRLPVLPDPDVRNCHPDDLPYDR